VCTIVKEVKFTGLTQNSKVDPAVRLKILVRALELAQVLGQPCGFQVKVAGYGPPDPRVLGDGRDMAN
jgi:hypothetical protein